MLTDYNILITNQDEFNDISGLLDHLASARHIRTIWSIINLQSFML